VSAVAAFRVPNSASGLSSSPGHSTARSSSPDCRTVSGACRRDQPPPARGDRPERSHLDVPGRLVRGLVEGQGFALDGARGVEVRSAI